MTGGDDRGTPVLRFDRKRVLIILVGSCVAIELLLVLLDATVNYANWSEISQIRRLVNMTREDALGSWFGVTQTFMVAVTLWLIWLVSRCDGSSRRVAAGWLVLALGFGYMAVDDGAEFHERMGSAFKSVYADDAREEGSPSLGGRLLRIFPSYPWQILFVPIFGALGLFIFVFLMLRLRGPTPKFWVLIAMSCFALAVGLDFVEGLDRDHGFNIYHRITKAYNLDPLTIDLFDEMPYPTLRHFSKSIEEFLEMLGMTIFWAVFASHFMQIAQRLKIEFRGGSDSTPVGAAD
jgi:hypothetical protein